MDVTIILLLLTVTRYLPSEWGQYLLVFFNKFRLFSGKLQGFMFGLAIKTIFTLRKTVHYPANKYLPKANIKNTRKNTAVGQFSRNRKRINFILGPFLGNLNPLSANPTNWLNTLKQVAGNLSTICLSLFDHFVGLVLKGLNSLRDTPHHSFLFLNWVYKSHYYYRKTPSNDIFEVFHSRIYSGGVCIVRSRGVSSL